MHKIILFNHFHRGDLHTSKEFIKQLQNELPYIKFEYWHNNPAKLLNDIRIPTTGTPNHLNQKEPFYLDEDEGVLYINTWVACKWDIFCKHGGINMLTFYETWAGILETVNSVFNTEIKLYEDKREYLPRIDYNILNTASIDNFIEKEAKDKKRVLICNNVPQSSQSFASTMREFIVPLAKDNPDIIFICTNEIPTEGNDNIYFTKNIINDTSGCDLQEVSYLSKFCDVIVGKNSGPYVFCETYDNLMDENKKFISFNTKHREYSEVKESMSWGLDLKCQYTAVPILNIQSLTEEDNNNIRETLIKNIL